MVNDLCYMRYTCISTLSLFSVTFNKLFQVLSASNQSKYFFHLRCVKSIELQLKLFHMKIHIYNIYFLHFLSIL